MTVDVEFGARRLCAAAQPRHGKPVEWRSLSTIAIRSGLIEPAFLAACAEHARSEGWLELDDGKARVTEAGARLPH